MQNILEILFFNSATVDSGWKVLWFNFKVHTFLWKLFPAEANSVTITLLL